ncbi:MAG: protein kinase, partial [Bryobacteraceae bacterium]
CEQGQLPLNERIALFRQVCSAVQYVHQNLVVHRDLKPSNILVTKDGVVKLLDFGIAKLVKPEMFGDLTRAEYRPMTPGYASPEQMRGEPITTASDVYSLGVLLYLLLASRSPYRLKTDSPHEMMLAVCDQEPEPPSTAVTGKLQRQLRGDLDNIVLRALRKEPHRRYASAEQFSEDLRRHLEGLPVSAHRDTWAYRAEKFVRRNRVGVAAAALVGISLTGGILAATWQARVAERERANAQQQFNDVRKLATSFLFEFHDAIQHLPGSTPARKLVVQRALEYLSKLEKEAHGDTGLERELAEAYLKVGDVQGNPYAANVGDPKGALQSYSEALRIGQGLMQANPNDLLARRYLARSHKSLAQVLPILGKPSEGDSHFQQAAALLDPLRTSNPPNEELLADLANIYQVRGDLLGHSGLPNLGNPAAALESYRKALRIYEEQVARNPDSQKAKNGQALVRLRIADIDIARGDFKRGLSEYRSILQELETVSAGEPSNAEALQRVALGYRKVNSQAAMALAITLRYSGDLRSKIGDPGALADYRKVLGILDQLAAAQPGNVLVASRRAETLLFVSEAMEKNGKREEARKMTMDALAITRRLAARPDVTADELFAYATTFLQCTPSDLREPATALDYAQQSLRKAGAPDSETLDLLAQAYYQTGESARAIETEKKALQVLPVDRGRGSSSALRRKLDARMAEFLAGRSGLRKP